MNPRVHTKKQSREMSIAKTLTAKEAIGKIEKGSDTYILTFGQFSLIDALMVILDQTGPADVVLSSWTAANAHLEKTADMVAASQITSMKLIIDYSFETRQPQYCERMRNLFGTDCIRHIHSHAKFIIVKNDEYNIVVRTSMNLNGNPRLENIEISESAEFVDFMMNIVDDIFQEVLPLELHQKNLKLDKNPQPDLWQHAEAEKLKRDDYNEPRYTHTLTEKERT